MCFFLDVMPGINEHRNRAPQNFYSKDFLTKHIKSIITFYKLRVVDKTGGFFETFDGNGVNFNPSFRHIVTSTRMVINFMLAGKQLGQQDLLEIGKHGLDYIENVYYVPETGCYAYTVRNHKPEDMVQQAYAYAFILAAHAAALSAGVSKSDADIRRVFDLLEQKFWLPKSGCYLDTISADGIVDNEYRGQNSNMHMCESMIAAYEATGHKRYLDRAQVLAETFTRKLAKKAEGFVWEHYTSNLEIDWDYNKDDCNNIFRPWGFQPGHQIEWAKNLLNIWRYNREKWMVDRAVMLFDGAWRIAWDAEHGGLVYGFAPDQSWCDAEKYFWVQAESLATATLLFEVTRQGQYIEKYIHLWQYCWEHWVDHEHGVWVGFKMTRENQLTSTDKANAGMKCDYHTLVSSLEALRALERISRL